MRIGIITHKYITTGSSGYDAGIFVSDIARRLSKTRFVSVLIVPPDGKKPLGRWSALNPYSVISYHRMIRNGTNQGRMFVKNNGIDILLAMWAAPAGIIARSLSRELHIPYAVWCLGSDINIFSKFPVIGGAIQNALSDSSLNIANSHDLTGKVRQLSHKPCMYIPAVTDVPQADSPTRRDHKVFRFLFVGRLEKIKGIDLLLTAANVMKDNAYAFHVTVMGDGSMSGWLRRQIRYHKLTGLISLTGNGNRSRVWDAMRSSDCLVVPSRSESMPLVVTEAVRAGLPVVATPVGDCKLIGKYRAGIVTDTVSPTGLARAMKRMADHRHDIQKMYSPGLKALAEIFNPAGAVRTLVAALEDSV